MLNQLSVKAISCQMLFSVDNEIIGRWVYENVTILYWEHMELVVRKEIITTLQKLDLFEVTTTRTSGGLSATEYRETNILECKYCNRLPGRNFRAMAQSSRQSSLFRNDNLLCKFFSLLLQLEVHLRISEAYRQVSAMLRHSYDFGRLMMKLRMRRAYKMK